MDSDSQELLRIQPKELLFSFEAKKKTSCCMQLTNVTDNNIAFKVKSNKPWRYVVQPNICIVPPRSTCDVNVTMQAQSEVPPAMQCEDKFCVQSVVVREGTKIENITRATFKVDAGNVVNEVNMKVFYIRPPGQPPPVREGYKEGPSPRTLRSDGGNIMYHDMDYASKKFLKIEPSALCFPFETDKQISCSMQLTNITNDYIASKVMNNHPERYRVLPKISILPPRSTSNVNVTMIAQKEAPPDMQCKDIFAVQSIVAREATTITDITTEMFKFDGPNIVGEVRLKVIYVQPPGPPSNVPTEFEECSSSHPSCSDWGNINYRASKDFFMETESTLHSVPLEYLKDITNNFCDERQIGRGGFGVVFKGVLGNGKVIAVKKFVQSMSSSQEQFENEVNLLMKLDHTNIVRLVGFCYETKPFRTRHEGKGIFAWDIDCLLCLEYLSNGSLDKCISGASCGLEWPIRFQIIVGVSYGLQYLHEQSDSPIIHLDLKPANILLDENMIPKITDFGLSRLFDQEQTIHTAITCGTLGYMPPEYLRGIITPMSDIFSLGVLIMEIITGHRDYPNDIRASSTEFIDLEAQRWRNVLQKKPGYTSLETDCQQIRLCLQIGLICVNPERAKRPRMKNIIDMLQRLESMDWYIRNEPTPHFQHM